MVLSNDIRSPGQFIRAQITERGWTQRFLALVLGIEESVVNKLVLDNRAVSAEMAIRLSEVFRVDAETILGLQKTYDLAKARITTRSDPMRATRAQLLGMLPVREMIRREWLDVPDAKDLAVVEQALSNFFGADSFEEIEILPHAAKKTAVSADVTPIQLAWLYRVRAIATQMSVPRYSPAAVRSAVKKLKFLLSSAEEVSHVPHILAGCGIRFVMVESLSGAKIDGVCFWLDDMAPVIGMTLRHDRIDNFWFVLRHEIEHVLRGHGGSHVMMDAELEGERAGIGEAIPEAERVANQAGADFCVPRIQMDRFYSRKSPFFAKRDILEFAAALNVHPGLVAGQLQHRTARYDRFREHLVEIRSIVAPRAAVDGWGAVFQING
ncbi:MAG: HigA family addiction module antidote protein [Anaerolineae bacterium]|nr:HigA family addiction module antidote protein [Gemmatimonadaceae bacterium]